MRQAYDLSSLAWTVTGWHPNYWHPGMSLRPDVAPVPARVPGSVQQALLQAGVIPDWNVRLDSRHCEWVENRHWSFEAVLPPLALPAGARALLVCEGLDYQGLVTIDRQPAGEFRGSLVPHTFDLTPLLAPGEHRLAIIFTDLPRYLGQIGYTSLVRDWKPRFNYLWDWVIRLVQVGIWDAIRLEVRQGDVIADLRLYTDYDHRRGRGEVVLAAGLELEHAAAVEVTVSDGVGEEVARERLAPTPQLACHLRELAVAPWHPNGNGERALYTVSLRLLDAAGRALDQETRRVGFRQVRWLPLAGAPPLAQPWLCEINGLPTFLQGVNWSPIRPNFADVTEDQYRQRLQTYHDLGCNVLRVWGGAALEKECFYRLCDELGLLV